MQVCNVNQTSFKSVIPTKYWLYEPSKKSYYVISDIPMIHKLQQKYVRSLNKDLTSKNIESKDFRIKEWFAVVSEYINNPYVRSFYNREGLDFSSQNRHFSYLLTGEDAVYINNLGKNIGKNKKDKTSMEINTSKKEYYKNGLDYVIKKSKEFKDQNNDNYILQIVFDIVRNTKGAIKDFKFKTAKFTKIVYKDK